MVFMFFGYRWSIRVWHWGVTGGPYRGGGPAPPTSARGPLILVIASLAKAVGDYWLWRRAWVIWEDTRLEIAFVCSYKEDEDRALDFVLC